MAWILVGKTEADLKNISIMAAVFGGQNRPLDIVMRPIVILQKV